MGVVSCLQVRYLITTLNSFEDTILDIFVRIAACPGQGSDLQWSTAKTKYLPYLAGLSRVMPPKKLLGDGVSTPMPLFCLICTIILKKHALWISTRNPILSEPGSILVDGFDTRLIPRSFSCGFTKVWWYKKSLPYRFIVQVQTPVLWFSNTSIDRLCHPTYSVFLRKMCILQNKSSFEKSVNMCVITTGTAITVTDIVVKF